MREDGHKKVVLINNLNHYKKAQPRFLFVEFSDILVNMEVLCLFMVTEVYCCIDLVAVAKSCRYQLPLLRVCGTF